MGHPSAAAKVTGPEVLEQVEKILASKSFGSSETMRHLLNYLAQHTVRSPDHPPKEHEIAVELLGRPADFDPKIDPVVRVQTSRLRSKLAEYYVAEGAGDRVYLEVPKGAYFLQASHRGPALSKGSDSFPWRFARGAVAVVFLVLAGIAAWRMFPDRGDARLRQFWRPYFDSPAETLMVYANPRFVGSSTTALRLFDPAKDHAEDVNPGYTGIGEVTGAAEASKLFLSFGRSLRLKRSQLFSWDDAKAHNLIFLGAPPHNVPLFQVPLGRLLKIKPFGEEPHKGVGCIHNLSPRQGEELYYCTYEEGPTRVEYSLVTMSPGVDPSKAVLIVAGTTTFGTQAAMEFFCDPERIEGVNRALRGANGKQVPAFDALIRCRVRGGVPVGAELVLVKQ